MVRFLGDDYSIKNHKSHPRKGCKDEAPKQCSDRERSFQSAPPLPRRRNCLNSATSSSLEQGVSDRVQTANPFLLQFDRQSQIYPLIDSLGAATDLLQLKTLSTVTDSEKLEIPSLKAEIEALQTTNPAAQLKLAETVRQHLDALVKSFSAVGRFEVPNYAKSLERLQKAEQEYEKATQESFAGLPIPGLLKEEWRRFIQAGEEYLKTLGEADKYLANGEECLYCRQPLSPEAVALLKKYRDYCNNDLRAELDGAGQEIEAVRQSFQRDVDFADVELSVRLHTIRIRHMTQEEFAEFVGMSVDFLSLIERVGMRPHLKRLIELRRS